jgi:hypothetical protein
VEIVQQHLLSLFPEEVVRGNLMPFSYHEPKVIPQTWLLQALLTLSWK